MSHYKFQASSIVTTRHASFLLLKPKETAFEQLDPMYVYLAVSPTEFVYRSLFEFKRAYSQVSAWSCRHRGPSSLPFPSPPCICVLSPFSIICVNVPPSFTHQFFPELASVCRAGCKCMICDCFMDGVYIVGVSFVPLVLFLLAAFMRWLDTHLVLVCIILCLLPPSAQHQWIQSRREFLITEAAATTLKMLLSTAMWSPVPGLTPHQPPSWPFLLLPLDSRADPKVGDLSFLSAHQYLHCSKIESPILEKLSLFKGHDVQALLQLWFPWFGGWWLQLDCAPE